MKFYCMGRFWGLQSLGVVVLGSVLMAGFGVGCGKDAAEVTEAPAESSDSESGNPLTAPVDYLGAINQAQKSSANKLSLMGVQQAIQQFQVMEERLPKNLQELVSEGYIARIPEAPKGTVIVYNPQTGVTSLATQSGEVGR